MGEVLSLQKVSLSYHGKSVLHNISLSVRDGETLALLGPSGCGKSSLLRVVMGFAAPSRGSVSIDGEEVSRDGKLLKMPEERNLSVVFQDLALWPHLNVFENLDFGLTTRGTPRDEKDHLIHEMLERVGLKGKESSYPGELSGGEKQRVAIARALVLKPRAVLLDEPLSNLDVVLKKELVSMFRDLLGERNLCSIYVTHDLREALSLGNRLAIMLDGHLVQTGTWEAISASPSNDYVRELAVALSWTGQSKAP